MVEHAITPMGIAGFMVMGSLLATRIDTPEKRFRLLEMLAIG